MLAAPEPKVTKTSRAKGKPPRFDEDTRYAGDHSRVFRRLGVDLLHVTSDGSAIVHSTPERVEQLAQTAALLPKAGAKEQARWITINSFAPIPEQYRIDLDWLATIPADAQADIIVELQPLLTVVEADDVMRAVLGLLQRQSNEALTGAGTDFSGRHWYRGRAGKKSLLAIARQLFSVEAVHRPMEVSMAGAPRGARRQGPVGLVSNPPPVTTLPVVGIVDGGVPHGHPLLAQYSRGQYIDPNSDGVLGDHGSLVASRVVFGDLDFSGGVRVPPLGRCRYLDVVVSEGTRHINAKSVVPAMEAVVAAFPDVRVFNCSFGSRLPLAALGGIDRREAIIAMRELDNFIFARDVLVVVAAGNAPEGVVPATQYPDHFDEAQWQLGTWCQGFNTLTCGSTVGRVHPNGLARNLDWPSPFTRVGPGMANAPVPDFAASGGDTTATYQYATPLGVYGCCPDGTWEDRCGTSYAAPLLAREAAFAMQYLEGVCLAGARPFGATVKAFLALTAVRPSLPPRVRALAERTIGRGYASSDRLHRPNAQSAVILWQGVLDGPKDIARVQIPIPTAWLNAATTPRLRLVWAWDSPVHDAVLDIWACRRVNVLLKSAPEAASVRGSRGNHHSYPLIEREYDLSGDKLAAKDVTPEGDLWILEIAYDETAEYFPSIEFSPQQRIGIAAELYDAAEEPADPQEFVQKLPVAATMISLGVPRARISVPIVIKQKR